MSRGKFAYPWQNNPVFRFFASLNLAMCLLITLIVAVAVGTVYESQFDAKVARAYIYEAAWFNVWLLLLCANLATVALSRLPWQKRHTGFLLTHLGIILVLLGALMGKILGVEGTLTLFTGEPPASHLMIDQKVVRVRAGTGPQQVFDFPMVHRKPTPDRPYQLGETPGGWKVSAVDYVEAMERKSEGRASAKGVPAVHIQLHTGMMKQNVDQWLFLNTEGDQQFDLGLALIDFSRELPKPDPKAPLVEKPTLESIFSFAKSPGDQIGKVREGEATGAKVQLFAEKDSYRVAINVENKPFVFPLKQLQDGPVPLPGTKLVARAEGFWNDFRLEEGKPANASDTPNNPAVLVTLSGFVKKLPGTEPAFAPQTPNWARVRLTTDGKLNYQIMSRAKGEAKGEVKVGEPVTTGWADWTLTVMEYLPQAEKDTRFVPLPDNAPPMQKSRAPDGVKLRLTNGTKSHEEWLAAGWEVEFPTGEIPLRTTFGFKTAQLPMGLQLEKFEVERNEGTDSPAGFKSTIKILSADGQERTAQCWMNNPASHPDSPFFTFTGLTFKIAQASWNPENLNQTTLQIIQDPGWLFKWIGSLILCCGIFTLFYLKPGSKKRATLSPDPAPEPVSTVP
jgi:hypothetical protein